MSVLEGLLSYFSPVFVFMFYWPLFVPSKQVPFPWLCFFTPSLVSLSSPVTFKMSCLKAAYTFPNDKPTGDPFGIYPNSLMFAYFIDYFTHEPPFLH